MTLCLEKASEFIRAAACSRSKESSILREDSANPVEVQEGQTQNKEQAAEERQEQSEKEADEAKKLVAESVAKVVMTTCVEIPDDFLHIIVGMNKTSAIMTCRYFIRNNICFF